jgi:glycosyltransferase involved in cell wall biosynthesis
MIGSDGTSRMGTSASTSPLAGEAGTAWPGIVLAHDWLVGMRGGEWVLDRLARLFGPTDLYTLVNDGQHLTDAIAGCRIITSPLQHFPGAAGQWRRHYLPLMPWAVNQLHVRNCKLVISTSSAVMKSINPPRVGEGGGATVPHVCYCHSPARYIWEQMEDYQRGQGGLVRALGLRLMQKQFQAWDRRTARRVTKFLANSQHTASRIKRCYNRDAQVVYPPVRTEFFTIDQATRREDWYLVVAALEPYKRTDITIEAATGAGFRLKVAGDGTQRAALEQAAGANVEFCGRVSDAELRHLYRQARALIFPQEEDFGIVAAEAQACGCPVVAFDRGGAAEIVTPVTGILFETQTSQAIIDAIERLERARIDPHACRDNAMRFREAAFDEAMLSIVHELIDGGN